MNGWEHAAEAERLLDGAATMARNVKQRASQLLDSGSRTAGDDARDFLRTSVPMLESLNGLAQSHALVAIASELAELRQVLKR